MSYGDPQPKWHNLKYAVPTAMMFISPWMHRALFANFMAACPDLMSPSAAHDVVWLVTAAVWFITFLWAVMP